MQHRVLFDLLYGPFLLLISDFNTENKPCFVSYHPKMLISQ